MTEDQRFAAMRPDVLVYQTEPLKEDITVAGNIKPEIFISSSGTDSDFVVKLIDVFPDDYDYPVTGRSYPTAIRNESNRRTIPPGLSSSPAAIKCFCAASPCPRAFAIASRRRRRW